DTLWYAVTIPPGERVHVALTYGTAIDLMVVAQEACSALECLGVADLFPPGEEAFTISNPDPTPFSVVLGVGPYEPGVGGTYDISFTYEPLPMGEICANAIPVTASGTFTGTTVGAGNRYDLSATGSCTGDGTPGPDIVYAVTLAAGQTLTATLTPDASFDPALYVVTDCSMAEATCQDGSDIPLDGVDETVSYTATSAQTVYLIVDSWDLSVAGAYTLDVALSP
ncbi:MAG TPA: hypothetical protein VIL20_07335, partial [Sandaracinaceae bacterium]